MDKISLRQFLDHFCRHQSNNKRFCFILGAGASKESGIRTGGELAEKWFAELKNDLFKDNKNLFEQWKKEKEIDENDLAKSYSEIFDKRFEVNREDGFAFLAGEMEGKEPSYGYSVLAQILDKTLNKVVITTNFDSLTEDALFIYTDTKPLVVVHESLANYIRPLTGRPVIVKIHRDLLLSPVNDKAGTGKLSEPFVDGLIEVFNCYTPVVIGYGGNDGSLMDFLEKIKKNSGGIFWCYREEEDLSERVKKLIAKHKGKAVPIAGFDALMAQLNDCLEYERLDKKLVEIAEKRADGYRKQYERLHQSADSDTKQALEDMVDRSPRDWWYYEQKARAEPDPDKQQKIYEEGVEACPDSYELLGNYANFMRTIRYDYVQAEDLYKRTLEVNPKYANNLSNYALFMSDIHHDYEQAEELYKHALEADQKNANNLGNYAIFLHTIRHDYNRAEEFYNRALAYDPRDANNLASYALFLNNIRHDYDRAEELYKRTLEVDPKHANNLGNYANFMKNIRHDYDRAEDLYKRALEVNPKHSNNLNNYAIFLTDIHHDYDRAEEFYKRVLDYDPKHANSLGNYAFFLNYIRRDYGLAEEFYKRTLQTDPKHVNTLTNYALFLIDVRHDYDRTEELYKCALEADPKHANSLGGYALFLSDIRHDYDRAEKLHKRALEAYPQNANNLGNYAKLLIDKGSDLAQVDLTISQALELNNQKSPEGLKLELYFYRYAVLWEKYPDALRQTEALLAQGGRSPGWKLDGVIERANALGHPDVNKLKALAKQIAESKQ